MCVCAAASAAPSPSGDRNARATARRHRSADVRRSIRRACRLDSPAGARDRSRPGRDRAQPRDVHDPAHPHVVQHAQHAKRRLDHRRPIRVQRQICEPVPGSARNASAPAHPAASGMTSPVPLRCAGIPNDRSPRSWKAWIAHRSARRPARCGPGRARLRPPPSAGYARAARRRPWHRLPRRAVVTVECADRRAGSRGHAR
jgi:hypothetical protein